MLLLSLGLVAVTWLEFEVFPGHTYLAAGTQIYLPILERLDAPGYLSRDLVAANPNVSYTIYDEVTLFLHEGAGLPFKTALTAQQLLFRFAGLTGVFLLARAGGLSELFAFLIASLVSLGAGLHGPAACLTDPEAVPGAFACGLTLLAAGLLTRGSPLASALAAGLALLYDPVTAAPFWAVVLGGLCCDAALRKLLRPALPVLFIFLLLLANLAQLQPGAAAGQPLWATLPADVAALQWQRTPYAWVSLWSRELLQYLAIYVFALWAAARLWPLLKANTRWVLLGIASAALLSVPVSYLLLERFHFALIARAQPTRTLVFTIAFSSLLFALAGMSAVRRRWYWESVGWFVLLFAIPLNTQIFEFLRLTSARRLIQLTAILVLAGVFTWLLASFSATRWRFATLLLPPCAALLFAHIREPREATLSDPASLAELSQWAEQNTWGSSMFLFPDAGRDLYPGVFRAQSRRALWADWKSGVEVAYSAPVGREWWNRWQETMQAGFSPQHLQQSLPLPIDYYALKRPTQLAGLRAVFTNRGFTVYDAQDLRNASAPLRLTFVP